MKQDHLQALLFEFFKTFFDRDKFGTWRELIASRSTKIVFVDGKVEEPLKAISSELGDSHPLRTDREVFDCIVDHWVEYEAVTKGSEHSFNPAELFERTLAGLVSPIRSFSFRLPLCGADLHHQMAVSMEIGGINQLRLETEETSTHRVTLDGKLDAPTVRRAIDAADVLLQQFIGALLSLDIAGVADLPPGRAPRLTFEISPTLSAEDQIFLSPNTARIVDGFFFRAPSALSEFEVKAADSRGVMSVMERPVRELLKLFSSRSPRALELRNAARLFLNCFSAADYGDAVTNAFVCLEAVLLEHSQSDNLVARLREAVAYRIGTSPGDRKRLRRQISELYDHRSKFVHTGQVREKPGNRDSLRDTVGLILRREIEDLEE